MLIFGVVVLAHELGHFFAARKSGIFVEEFAIGMGPKLFSRRRDENSTLYSVRAIPIGGFCKMLGYEAECSDERAFNNKKLSRRVLVLSAGALMNFLLAFLIFLGLVTATGYPTTTVRDTIEGMPGAAAGLKQGDKITHINGARVFLYEDLLFELNSSGGKPIDVRVTRGGERLTLSLTPYRDDYGEYKIGFYTDRRLGLLSEADEGYRHIGFFDSIGTAFNRIIFYIKSTVVGITRLITRRAGMAEMAGPIGIVSVIGETYKETIQYSVLSTVLTMLNLCALLSANLGVINLFPLPALDGGRLVFLGLEGIRRKPITPEREGMVHFVGFVLLMLLAAFIAYQDIVKLL